nr:hypothetical protein [Tanacetum cinerariifolium]
YDVLDVRDKGETMADDGNESSDSYCSSDEEDLSYVDFHSELDDNVVINTVSTNDPFLNKLCGENAKFIKLVDEPVNENVETVKEDTENIDPMFNVKEGIKNYEVANGYPLWFYRNDWRKLLVYYGRDVELVSTRSRSKSGEGTSKSPNTPVKAITFVEACSESPKWTKSKRLVAMNRVAMTWEHSITPSIRKRVEFLKEKQRGRGSRRGRGGFGGRGERTANVGESSATIGTTEHMIEDEIRKNLEHDYMEDMLLQEEQKFDAYQAQQDEFDQEALRYTLEEEARFKRHDEKRLKEQLVEQEWGKIGFRLGDFVAEDNNKSNANLEIPSEEPIAAVTPSANKGKQLAERSEQPKLQPQAIKRGSKRKAPGSSEEALAK